MGVKRSIDSGRVDSLGRPIKVSGNSSDSSTQAKAKGISKFDGGFTASDFAHRLEHQLRDNPKEHLAPLFQTSDARMTDEMWDEVADNIIVNEEACESLIYDFDAQVDDKDEFVSNYMNYAIDPDVGESGINYHELMDIIGEMHRNTPFEMSSDTEISVIDCEYPSDDLINFIKDDFSDKKAVMSNLKRDYLPYLPPERLSELADEVEFDFDAIKEHTIRYGQWFRDGYYYHEEDSTLLVDHVAEGVIGGYDDLCNIKDIAAKARSENSAMLPSHLSHEYGIDEDSAQELSQTIHDLTKGNISSYTVDYLIPQKDGAGMDNEDLERLVTNRVNNTLNHNATTVSDQDKDIHIQRIMKAMK